MIVLSFKNDNDHPTRYSFLQYCILSYMPLEEIKNFNGLIDNKSFFEQPEN